MNLLTKCELNKNEAGGHEIRTNIRIQQIEVRT